jgi:microcystin-dependent protein
MSSFKEEQQGVPVGTIIIWTDALSNVPSGWVLCDGANGTPDLRDRFVKGTSSGEAPGKTGGQKTWTMSTTEMPSHSHGGSTSSDGAHNHVNGGRNLNVEPEGNDKESPGQNAQVGSWDTTYGGYHSHSLDIGSAGTSNPSSVNNQPSHYEVAFIMRV